MCVFVYVCVLWMFVCRPCSVELREEYYTPRTDTLQSHSCCCRKRHSVLFNFAHLKLKRHQIKIRVKTDAFNDLSRY